MRIQLISNRCGYRPISINQFSTINSPYAFDSFDINIIDLSSDSIWKNENNSTDYCNYYNDFRSLKQIIDSSQESKTVIVLPQNVKFFYAKSYSGKYTKSIQIKDMLHKFTKNILNYLIDIDVFGELFYENSETYLNNVRYESAFVFEVVDLDCNVIAESCGSHKATVIMKKNIVITTLDIFSRDEIIDFLIGAGLIAKKRDEYPAWLKDFEILDDAEQKELIAEKKAQIEEANLAIQSAEDKLNENLEFKSILYENGDLLVEHVYKILQEVLNKDMSNFIDEKKEDFNVSFDNVTFIGEIKGVTSNVKSEHISQLDVHCQGYKDKLQEENKEENVKGLLVINPLRNKPLEDREPIHEQQIALAKRNESLIIETELLLELFEKFRNNEITTEKIIEVFSTETGLLKMEVFEQNTT